MKVEQYVAEKAGGDDVKCEAFVAAFCVKERVRHDYYFCVIL